MRFSSISATILISLALLAPLTLAGDDLDPDDRELIFPAGFKFGVGPIFYISCLRL
jgi:hypothetical protein